jgi:hypothetical protein
LWYTVCEWNGLPNSICRRHEKADPRATSMVEKWRDTTSTTVYTSNGA